jgi:hypothetical protein
MDEGLWDCLYIGPDESSQPYVKIREPKSRQRLTSRNRFTVPRHKLSSAPQPPPPPPPPLSLSCCKTDPSCLWQNSSMRFYCSLNRQCLREVEFHASSTFSLSCNRTCTRQDVIDSAVRLDSPLLAHFLRMVSRTLVENCKERNSHFRRKLNTTSS